MSLEVSLNSSTVCSPHEKMGCWAERRRAVISWERLWATTHFPWPLPLLWLDSQLCPRDVLQQQWHSFLEILTFKGAFTFQVITARLQCLVCQTQINNYLCISFTVCFIYTSISLSSLETEWNNCVVATEQICWLLIFLNFALQISLLRNHKHSSLWQNIIFGSFFPVAFFLFLQVYISYLKKKKTVFLFIL